MTSMINTNNIGDSGSPWRSPRPWWIVSLGTPLRMIRVLVVDSRPRSIHTKLSGSRQTRAPPRGTARRVESLGDVHLKQQTSLGDVHLKQQTSLLSGMGQLGRGAYKLEVVL
jgi:hypothetical protein